ncbi:MAG TPA: PIN domain-containing protein [Dehalococcoidia bacterium]|nr:PIN domain-containing protein [Dehalococcoidia bacterium]
MEKGSLILAAPDTVIADAVWILASPRLYHIARSQVAAMLATLVRLLRFRIGNPQVVLAALSLYRASNVDFGDAMIVASMQEEGATEVYSYDCDFDAISNITRREP